MLHVNDISKKYHSNWVFNNISFSVNNKQILGLTGPSGSGKSTLLRCIQQLESIDSGHITGNQKSGFMFQDFQLFPHMTVLNNISYSPIINNMKDPINIAKKILNKLDIANKAHVYPSQLSGGQKQRVALARTLMMKPTLLLCDEPTSGLDTNSIEEVVNLLLSSSQQGNISMIIASHDLNFLNKLTNHILVLENSNLHPI